MTFREFQDGAKKTANPNIYPDLQLANWGMGLAGEAGETCDYLKKVLFQGHSLDKDRLSKELGDVLYYVAMCAETASLDLHDIAVQNQKKLKERYPDGFSPEKSINREN